MRVIIGLVIIYLLVPTSFAQTKYWELKQEDLEKYIRQADLIATGNIDDSKVLKVIDVLKGPQQVQKVALAGAPLSERKFDLEFTYICFLRLENGRYIPFVEILKSDIFLIRRIRNQIMAVRVDSSDYVVMAEVKSLKEFKADTVVQVNAECQMLEMFKGQLPATFSLEYQRIPKAQPPTVFLFENLTYIFFIKTEKDKLCLINAYDGAFAVRQQLVKEIKTVTRLENRYDEVAGQVVDGIQLFAKLPEDKIGLNQPIVVYLLLQNVSPNDLEIYHNPEQIPYFLLVHVIGSDGNIIPTEYPRRHSIPDLDKTNFLKLVSGGYFTLPPLDIQQYCKLPIGKYIVYVEYDLPWKYAGKPLGKSAWSGKVMSSRLELEITEP